MSIDASKNGSTGAELLICIVKSHKRVEDIMTGFLELGIKGATVLDAKGMGQIISAEIPIFTGFKSLFPGWGVDTYMIFSVIEDRILSRAIQLVEEVCSGFEKPGVGILLTLPISRVKGLAEEIR